MYVAVHTVEQQASLLLLTVTMWMIPLQW
jgi:hypothetical protein